LQQGVDRLARALVPQDEDALDERALRPGAYVVMAGPPAQQQRHGVEDDGLARAGLARQHVEARRKPEGEVINDREVSNRDFAQHGPDMVPASSRSLHYKDFDGLPRDLSAAQPQPAD